MTWMQLYTGGRFDFVNIDRSTIEIDDIAHALSLQCRFNGHVRQFYSVAQHCVMVAQLCSAAVRLEGLLHDAAEAFTGDCVKPLKGLLPDWAHIECRVELAIARKFGLLWPWPVEVNTADAVLLATEARDLLPGGPQGWLNLPEPLPAPITPWPAEVARQNFTGLANLLLQERRRQIAEGAPCS